MLFGMVEVVEVDVTLFLAARFCPVEIVIISFATYIKCS